MALCIYTGADETTDTFSSAEHIFPKCIGGIQTLPKGWVCDSVNNSLSSLELRFARQNPSVAIPRMFLPQTGRRKHKNRNLIGIFRNTLDSNDYSLGYISNGKPLSINQICITARIPISNDTSVPLTIVVPPQKSGDMETQIRSLWARLKSFDGKVFVIKDKGLPSDKFLLGYQDSRWYLGMSENLNGETTKQAIFEFITRMTEAHTVDELLSKGQMGKSLHQVHSQFSIQANLYDIMRVYAKIAVNCLARLRGQDFILNEAFDGIKDAILTGVHIDDYVRIHNGPSTLKSVFRQFEGRFTLGRNFHSTVIVYSDGCLYAEVALYGADNPYIIKLGQFGDYSCTDCYICDWENGVEYTLIDCVLQICKQDEEEYMKY